MKYIEECLKGISDPSILEVGAGTGRYSVTLAKRGLHVAAVELIEHNLEILKSKLDGTEPITTLQGNALDLSVFPDDSFDLTMMLGPMYHLYTKEEKLKALSEAVRVTKPNGYILVAYCMNEPTVIQYMFGLNHLHEVMDLNILTDLAEHLIFIFCSDKDCLRMFLPVPFRISSCVWEFQSCVAKDVDDTWIT
jgi:ubiquinone/menaquinone biosynthesis C-methylase UbiE